MEERSIDPENTDFFYLCMFHAYHPVNPMHAVYFVLVPGADVLLCYRSPVNRRGAYRNQHSRGVNHTDDGPHWRKWTKRALNCRLSVPQHRAHFGPVAADYPLFRLQAGLRAAFEPKLVDMFKLDRTGQGSTGI